MAERIFAADWRACQEEHLRAVVAAGDERNEATLVQLLQEVGFDADRLAALGTVAPAAEQAPESPPPGATETGSLPATVSEALPDPVEASQLEEATLPEEEPGLTEDEPEDAGDEAPDEGGDPATAQLSLF